MKLPSFFLTVSFTQGRKFKDGVFHVTFICMLEIIYTYPPTDPLIDRQIAKMHFPCSTSSSSSLFTIFCLLLVIISLFLPGASARIHAIVAIYTPGSRAPPANGHTGTALNKQHVGCSRSHQVKKNFVACDRDIYVICHNTLSMVLE
ncbi:uncharacterized protein LOC120286613 [Eucalyptus grandis]|uniref:uncharacterized protein LOC120286613 n=1 Tax=Eucalyptus grandis TaxID=71139 RepID=UPI00192EF1FD|nr:uncharacterized protein LOC120286613 [Eucalyptus grandis]